MISIIKAAEDNFISPDKETSAYCNAEIRKIRNILMQFLVLKSMITIEKIQRTNSHRECQGHATTKLRENI